MDNDVKEFKEIAKSRWEHLEIGNSRAGNTCFEKLNKIAYNLKSKNELDKLVVLLEDMDDGVKFEAASKLLFLVPDKATTVLTNLTKNRGILSFTAKQTLKQWAEDNMENSILSK